jgi:hypothetical protein
MDEFINNWVAPYYLSILHGNYLYSLKDDVQTLFHKNVKKALLTLNDEIIQRLLSGGWREQITGSWFCGIKGLSEYVDTIGIKLVKSKMTYAGQGHCFALACFANDKSVKYLAEYLDIYLSKTNLIYDQAWVMPALMWVDEQNNTTHASRFIVSGGLWDGFIEEKDLNFWRLDNRKEYFWKLMNHCRENFMKTKVD